ncbi:sorting nexin-29-like [Clavelina lepadiformis]|uniref:sorting nexin-29-like n=1 Tax=Clavelina lepadiformis TaxID=159417 RepID=UPI00404384EE
MGSLENERVNLHSRLLDAVRACQTHLGGKKELVTETSIWVSCLCSQFQAVLQHRLKPALYATGALSAIKQVAVGGSGDENSYWNFVKNHLTKHEVERFEFLPNIGTDIGRGRAWLRCCLNEHSLERYFHIFLSDVNLLRDYYEPEAFMLDQERSSTLPQMAAGLGSIVFKIKYDDISLDGSATKPQPSFASNLIPNLINVASSGLTSKSDSAIPNSSLEAQSSGSVDKIKKKAGRKKRAKIISFGDDDLCEGSATPAQRGGPGFVVVRSSAIYPKSTAPTTLEASSAILSETNINVSENSKEPMRNMVSTQLPDSIINRSSVNNRIFAKEPDFTNTTGGQTGSNNISDINSSQPVNPTSVESRLNYLTSTPDKKAEAISSQANNDSAKNDELGEVTRHLMSMRHNSALGSHDLIMDDWSVQSGSNSGICLQTDNTSGELYPVRGDDDIQSSDTRSDILTGTDTETSSNIVLSSAHKAAPEINSWKETAADLQKKEKSEMTVDELQQAFMAVMQRKDEIEEASRSTRSLLDTEMEYSASLRLEIETLQAALKEQREATAVMQQQHIRENEVLRNQLKKYVGAVQALQRGDKSVDLPLQPSHNTKDQFVDSDETSMYEKKLIEVAEMHGELMEFNERLHVRLQSAVSLLHNMKSELVDLRGPMPNDDLIKKIENDSLSGANDYSPPIGRALINIWMPSVFLKGKGPEAHHLYQVYVRIGDEEWNIYRRYSHFHELHIQLRKKFPVLDSYGFPPKKAVGNKGKKFVEYRRKALQTYLRLMMNNVVQNNEKLVESPAKSTLIALLPFFSETLHAPSESKKQRKGLSLRRSDRN